MNFKIKIENNPLTDGKSFRIIFNNKWVGLGDLSVLANANNEDLAMFLEFILNEAIKIILEEEENKS